MSIEVGVVCVTLKALPRRASDTDPLRRQSTTLLAPQRPAGSRARSLRLQRGQLLLEEGQDPLRPLSHIY